MSVAAERPKVSQPRPFLRPAIKEELTGWLFASPWIIGFLLFTAAPMLFSIYASFTDYNITTTPKWTGVANYQKLFRDPYFFTSLANTFWMVIVKTPIVIVVSIALALLLAMNVPGGRFFRTVFYLPNVLAGVAAVFLWQWILAPNGLLNQALGVFGIEGPAWFSNPDWTKPGLVVMGMWWIGSNVLIYLAGIKGIPKELYEAADIDGAVGWARTWNITLPLLSPTIFFQVVTGIIGAFQIFSTAFIISNNDPFFASQSLLFYVLYLYYRAFGKIGPAGFQMGYASAMAWILFVIIMIFTLVQLWLSKRWVYYESEG
ncbi:MAG TPA: sugar ABC transporter permease [Roseiflexaceae bacterium]|jgi:multiple sugar transport system permease protein|nr:sugar ABC transporter permease [Roseiflexaceae bacterium]